MNRLDLIILLGTGITISLAVAYVLLALRSSRLLQSMQQSKLLELQKSEQRLILLFEHTLAGMFKFHVRTFDVVDTNTMFRSMLHWESDDTRKSFGTVISASDREIIHNQLLKDQLVRDYELKCSPLHGEQIWCSFSATQIFGEEYANGVIIDITNRKLIEESHEEQAALLNETQDAIIVLDDRANILFWNTSAEFIYGYPKQAVLGEPLLNKLYTNGNKDEFNLAWTDVIQYREWIGNQHQNRHDGSEVLVESHWKKIKSKISGREIVLIVNTDITEKKKMEEMYLRAQKMETLALLTGGIAHDLQNILAPVSVSIGLLKEDVKQSKSLQILDAVEESAKSGIQLLKKILTIGKGIKGENDPVHINELVDGIIESFSIGLPETIHLLKDYRQNDFYVMGDQSQLHQVFLNLFVNARDAMPDGGTITVTFKKMSKKDSVLQEFTNSSLSYGVFIVSDTGIGIKESDLDLIFDPFFTTKPMEKGTGLGLSIVQNIVKNHEGFIEVESTVGKGSSFKLYFPIVKSIVNV